MIQSNTMKHLPVYACIFLLTCLFSCKSKTQSDTEATAAAIQAQTATASAPETSGAFVRATIDDKPWEARKVIPDPTGPSDYKKVTAEGSEINISFQIFKPQAGQTYRFDENHVADLWIGGETFGGRSGQVNITRIDGNWMDGTFEFKATTLRSAESHDITNGSFHVPIIAQQ